MTSGFPQNDDQNAQASTLAVAVTSVTAYAMSKGMTLEDLQRVAHVSDAYFANPKARVPEDSLPKIWRELSRRFPDEAIGIEFAKSVPFWSLGEIFCAAQYAKDVRQALGLVIRNRSYFSERLEMGIHETVEEAALVVRHPMDEVDKGRMREVGFGMIWRFLKEVLKLEITPLRVEFRNSQHGRLSEYEAFFESPVVFGTQRDAIVLRQDDMRLPLRSENAQLFSFGEIYYDQMVRALRDGHRSKNLSHLIDAVCESITVGEFGVENIALRARMSVRSAQRTASENGTTLRKLIQEAKAARAKSLLLENDISIKQIAFILGYSSERTFRRAFGEWYGTTPSRYRRR